MKLIKIEYDFSVCQLENIQDVNFQDEFVFLSKTDDEISLVCKTDSVPKGCKKADHGWKALKIDGQLDFSLIGILSKISTILSNHNIGIFAVSTYNTDYILVKKEDFEKACDALSNQGYAIL